MRTMICTLAALALAAPTFARTDAVGVDPGVPRTAATTSSVQGDDDGRGTPYIVDKTDNVCGIDEPRALTNPATIDYDALLKATPEVKKIIRRKIDKESAEGIRLMTEARSRVLAATEAVQGDLGYCSVWKKIERRDKKPIDDITDQVEKKIEEDDEGTA